MQRGTKKKHTRLFQSDPPPVESLFAPILTAPTSSRGASRRGSSSSMKANYSDDAEDRVVSIVEDRRRRAGNSSDWNAAVDGELPPMNRLPDTAIFSPGYSVGSGRSENAIPTFRDLARRVRTMTGTGKMSSMRNLFLKQGSQDQIENIFGNDNDDAPTHMDTLITGALKMNELFEEDDEDEDALTTRSNAFSDDADAESDEQLLPLTANDVEGFKAYGTSNENSKKRKKKKKKKKKSKLSQFWCLPRSRTSLAEVINPEMCAQGLIHLVFNSSLAYVTFPALVVAAILYYGVGNPALDFMPQDSTISWWLLFFARQGVTFEIAVILQHVVVEGLALRTKWLVFAFGPLVTLGFIQAKGWPLIAVLWSLIDLCVLHGDNVWQQNWFYFLEIGLFSQKNKGGDFLYTDFYLSLLLAMLLAGFCHAVKRTSVAMSFGKRTLFTYKARLEKILTEIVLITEVAELANELEALESMNDTRINPVLRADNKWRNTMDINYTGTRGKASSEFVGEDGQLVDSGDSLVDDDSLDENDDSLDEDDEDEEEDDGESEDILSDDGQGANEEDAENAANAEAGTERAPASQRVEINSPDSTSGRVTGGGTISTGWSQGSGKIKRLLDRWEDPENKLDKSVDASIADILKFRKALTYMDDPNPFGNSFGPAATRDQCIKSSQRTYRRLLRTTNQPILNFDVIKILAISESGDIEEAKELALNRLFRPDSQDELSLLAFVQTIDTTYKKLRFFRASVGNSSVINQVLESLVDHLVNFILVLVILTMLQFNPYPILVSLSTVMVSLAFAVGSSASKYIEGVLVIAVRRPYDIGDRILINQAHEGATPGVQTSWFVQDTNLWCTTIRFAGTNEVATVNNGSLAALRIVNCNRSPNALITLDLKFDLAKINQENLDSFRQQVENYVSDRRRIYDGFVFFRCDELDTMKELASFKLRVRHRRAWQDFPLILNNRADLLWFCIEVGKELDINYIQYIPAIKVIKGEPEEGDKDSHTAAADNLYDTDDSGYQATGPVVTVNDAPVPDDADINIYEAGAGASSLAGILQMPRS